MFAIDKKAVTLSLIGFIITVTLFFLPHLNIINMQTTNGLEIIYTPSHVNGNSTRFDDQVKLLPSVQLAREGQITGKVGNVENSEELYPNVLQEIVVAFIYAPIIAITNQADSPYYVLPLLVGLIYLMSFYLIRSFKGDLVSALTLPLIMIFGYFFITFGNYFILPNGVLNPQDIFDAPSRIESWTNARVYDLNSFYRIHTLGASYFFFLAYVYIFYRCLKDGVSAKKHMIPMAVILALQFYCYVFYSIAAAMSFLGAVIWLFVYSIFKRDNSDIKLQATYMFYSGLIAFILALPSMIETMALLVNKEHLDWLIRISSGENKAIAFWGNNYLYGGLILCLLGSNNHQLRILSISLIIPVLLVENSGILFGMEMQPGHISMRAVLPVSILLFGSILYFLALRMTGKLKVPYLSPIPLYLYRSMATIIAGYFVLIAYNYSHTFAEHTYKFQGVSSSQVSLHNWMQERPNSVVATLIPDIAVPLMFHSHSYLYLTFSGHLHQSVTNRDIDNRLVNVFWLFNTNKEQLVEYFNQEEGREFDRRYHYYYWQRRFGYPRADERLNGHLTTLNDMIANYDVRGDGGLCQHPFDYLVVDHSKSRQTLFSAPKFRYLTEQVRFEDIVVYKFNVEKLDCNTQ